MDNIQQMKHVEQQREIDLVDLFVVLYRRRTTIFLTMCVCVLLATGYWFVKSKQSIVTAAVSTGRVSISELNIEPLMNPSESERLLNSIYIPNSIAKYQEASKTQSDIPIIKILKSKDKKETASSVIVLTCETKEKLIPTVLAIMNSAVDELVATHSVHYERYTLAMNDLIEAKKLQLSAIKANEASEDATMPTVEARHDLEAAILRMQSRLATSYPSTIVRTASVVPQEPPSTVKLAAGLVIASVFLGCCVAFFLDLLGRAKSRDAEYS